MKTRPNNSFTLIEMLVAMAVFILLAGSVFAILSAVLQTTSSLQDDENHRDQISALDQFLRHQLQSLPAQSNFISYQRKESEGLTTNGILFGLPSLLCAFDAKLQPNGYYQLRWTELSPQDQASQNAVALTNPLAFAQDAVKNDAPNLDWKPLISDVRIVGWKFQDNTTLQWTDTWIYLADKPHVAELTVQLAGDLQPTVLDLWVPKLVPIMVSPIQNTP